jgi:hypothetical protein
MYLKVSPIRGLRRFKVKGKFSPRYIGSFKILERKGEVSYQLELPVRLSDVHNVFHIQRVSHIIVEELFGGSRGTVATGGFESTG